MPLCTWGDVPPFLEKRPTLQPLYRRLDPPCSGNLTAAGCLALWSPTSVVSNLFIFRLYTYSSPATPLLTLDPCPEHTYIQTQSHTHARTPEIICLTFPQNSVPIRHAARSRSEHPHAHVRPTTLAVAAAYVPHSATPHPRCSFCSPGWCRGGIGRYRASHPPPPGILRVGGWVAATRPPPGGCGLENDAKLPPAHSFKTKSSAETK